MVHNIPVVKAIVSLVRLKYFGPLCMKKSKIKFEFYFNPAKIEKIYNNDSTKAFSIFHYEELCVPNNYVSVCTLL